MAFSSSTTTAPCPTVIGNQRYIFGTFTNGEADSGGAITTGLSVITACGIFFTSHTGLTEPKFTVSGGTITIVTPNGADGNWWAIGA